MKLSRCITRVAALLVALTAGGVCQSAPTAEVPDEEAQVDKVVVTSSWTLPADLLLRARVTRIEPDERFEMGWRYGGEGLGGNVVRGTFTPEGVELQAAPTRPGRPGSAPAKVMLEDARDPRFKPGEWSHPVALRSICRGAAPEIFFLTVTAGGNGATVDGDYRRRTGHSVNVRFEFELLRGSRTLKHLAVEGPHGGTVGLMFPFELLSSTADGVPQPFLDGWCDLLTYARRRGEMLRALPWSDRPVPRKLAILTDINGHGEGIYYGIRYTDPAIMEEELRNVRELGVNGLRGGSWMVHDRIEHGDGVYEQMRRVAGIHNGGYPSPRFVKGRSNDPEAGCPYAPGVPQRQQEGIEEVLRLLDKPHEEIWSLTEDEIGAVVDRSAEGKSHLSSCPRCAEAYREHLRGQSLSPGDFGVESWDKLNPIDVWAKQADKPWLTDPRAALNAYHSRLFINHASAQLFTPMRDAVARANARKLAALNAGEADTPAARQPWIYTYALRGNTFLLGGHSLDFFDFYRLADNGFCHETSNRDARVWNWDSYLLDVGRVVCQEQQLALGLYVKPHRGAPIQRALSAAGRGARMIFLYTYGPDYAKGDSFSERQDSLALTSKAARLLGASEHLLWQSRSSSPSQTAIIKPRAGEVWMQFTGDHASRAAWEDAKFSYTALTHSFVPLDPIDQSIVQTSDLSAYRVIYLLGRHFPRAASRRLMAWVHAGGTLVLHAGGMSRDEADQPLTELHPMLGVRVRHPVEMWKSVPLYGASRLQPFEKLPSTPAEMAVQFTEGALKGQTANATVGREVLEPLEGAQVLATFADGAAAAIRHRHGKGEVILLGVFAGLEYTAPQREGDFDMQRDLVAPWRAVSAGVAVERTTRPAWADRPNLELRRVQSPDGVTGLMVLNWAYHVAGVRVRETDGRSRTGSIIKLCDQTDVRITIPDAAAIARVRSAWHGHELPLERGNDNTVIVTLPALEEADVLLFEPNQRGNR